jgi:2'-5' RNA ligase
LFVAVPVPESMAGQLAKLLPYVGEGVRAIVATDFHVTLHFLGSREISGVSSALQTVEAASFSIRLTRPGVFRLRNRKTILMVGVEPVAGLIDLHRQTATALETVGFVPERRPYVPHITLARLSPKARRGLVDTFCAASLPPGSDEFSCGQFALYASETAPDGACYRILEHWSLVRPG